MSRPEEEAILAERKEVARKVTYTVSADSAHLIVELGQERLKALQAAGIALDARTTQVAVFQLPAAAFAGGVAAQSAQPFLAAALAFTACLAFVIGSGIAFWGMRSCKTQVAGVDPTFWRDALDHRRFTYRLARSWAAEVTEGMIVAACKVDEMRARWLNASLICGGIGGLCVLAAVFANLLDRARLPPPAAAPVRVLAGPGFRIESHSSGIRLTLEARLNPSAPVESVGKADP